MTEPRQRVRNAADREQVEKARKEDARNAKRYATALYNTMNTIDGRIVMTQLLRKTGIGVGEQTATVFSDSGALTAYQSGQQDIGNELQEALKRTSLKLYHVMESEAREVIETEELENSNG